MANNFCYVKQFMYKRNNTFLVQIYGLSFTIRTPNDNVGHRTPEEEKGLVGTSQSSHHLTVITHSIQKETSLQI